MAAHLRAQIRDAVVAALTGLPMTGSRVYSGRTRALAQGYAPTLLVYAIEERSGIHAMGNRAPLVRALTIAIDGLVSGIDPPDGALDQIANEIEPAMVADPSFGGIVKAIELVATRITARADGEAVLGEIHLEYQITYRTKEDAPDVPA